jgi:hypothetical protein
MVGRDSDKARGFVRATDEISICGIVRVLINANEAMDGFVMLRGPEIRKSGLAASLWAIVCYFGAFELLESAIQAIASSTEVNTGSEYHFHLMNSA